MRRRIRESARYSRSSESDSELLKSWNQNDLTIGRGEEILAADKRGWTPIRRNVFCSPSRHRHRPEHGGTFGNGGSVRFLGAPIRAGDLRRSETLLDTPCR